LAGRPHDSHAVACVGQDVAHSLRRVVQAFGLENYHIETASVLEQRADYKAIVASIAVDIDNPYVRAEVADVMWHHMYRRSVIKVGWVIDPTGRTRGTSDERLFDDALRHVYGNAIAPLYCL